MHKRFNRASLTSFFMVALAIAASTPASAATQSAYTDIDLDECTILSADDFGARYACPGYRGYPLYIAEGDLRYFVSFGFGAPDEMAASQTPAPFNTLGDKIEWRLSNQSGRFLPFAAIIRYHLDDPEGGDNKGEELIVTKIAPGNTCHIAYVDAKTAEKPNERARELADTLATDFDCQTDEPVRGGKAD